VPVVPAGSSEKECHLARVANGSFEEGSFLRTFLMFNIAPTPAMIRLSLFGDGGLVGHKPTAFGPATLAGCRSGGVCRGRRHHSLLPAASNLKVPSEIRVYQAGGHGFGIGTPQCSCAGCMDLFSGWLDVTLRNPASP
jgi:hypothetical protein